MNTEILFSNDSNKQEEILKCLQTLYETPVGTVALDRNFGLNWDFLDLPMQQAKGRLTIEMIEKTRMYEPRVSIENVNFTQNNDGKLKAKVVLRFV